MVMRLVMYSCNSPVTTPGNILVVALGIEDVLQIGDGAGLM
jgi:hypothetical protein